MSGIEVIENFLPRQKFSNLRSLIMDKPFPWFYVGFWVDRKELEKDEANGEVWNIVYRLTH